MRIPFRKMHGAGNDFIVVDDRARTFPCGDRAWLARIARRRTGVGGDGIALVQPSARADVSMRFFNPDGAEAEMCGNAARCVARFAAELGAAPARMRIETAAGILAAEVLGETVRLALPDPADWRLDRELSVDGRPLAYDFVNTGVPHVVLRVDDAAAADVDGVGRAVRRHPAFQPAGTNVNFVAPAGPRALRIRTYERGVEAETLACGTGITAAAVVAARRGWAAAPVAVHTAGGDVLTVDFTLDGGGAHAVRLTGPAAHVYEGVLAYEAADATGGQPR